MESTGTVELGFPVVLGGHHDSHFTGALANDTSCVAQLVIAKALKMSGRRPASTLVFFNTTAEEWGLASESAPAAELDERFEGLLDRIGLGNTAGVRLLATAACFVAMIACGHVAWVLAGEKAFDDIVAGFKAGADDYIPKPFNPHQLQAMLVKHMVKLAS